jgi:hypothetical protein
MKTYRYRVNYGQGQVEYPGSKAECFRFLAEHCRDCGFAYVQWQDPDTGDWFRTGTN